MNIFDKNTHSLTGSAVIGIIYGIMVVDEGEVYATQDFIKK